MPVQAPSIYRDDVPAGSTDIFNPEVAHMLSTAEEVAKSVLWASGDRSIGAGNGRPLHIGKIHIGNRYDGFFLNSFNQTDVYGGCGVRREKDDQWRVFVGVAGSVVALVTAYFVGRDWGSIREADEELDRVYDERKGELPRYQEADRQDVNMVGIRRVLKLEEQIFQRMKGSFMVGIALKVSLAASAILAVVGAVLGSSTIALGASAIGLVVGAGVLIRAGFNESYRGARREAQALLRELEPLKQASRQELLVDIA